MENNRLRLVNLITQHVEFVEHIDYNLCRHGDHINYVEPDHVVNHGDHIDDGEPDQVGHCDVAR